MLLRGSGPLAAAGLATGLALLASVLPIPYVALFPGPTTDTLGAVGGKQLIKIEGRPTYPTQGELRLTTVEVDADLRLGEAVVDWLNGERAVVPREVVYPPGRTREQVREQNSQEMVQSQETATVAALTALRLPSIVRVATVGEGQPADGLLEAGDVITTVDGAAVKNSADLRARVRDRRAGDPVVLGVRRDGRDTTVRLVTAAADDGRPVAGIVPEDEYGFDVEIALEDVGGPSAGLMFALGIYDVLTPGPLTGGKRIAGTGTIDPAGQVGPIGGILQKLVAARAERIDHFLVPARNCAEALTEAPDGLDMVRVESLDDALRSLETIRAGRTDLPRCGVAG